MLRMRISAAGWLLLALAGAAPGEESAPVFTRRPTAAREGAGVRIEFAVDRETDVCVLIENATGEVVRHLAAGVLGKNPPAPLRPGTLDQSLLWDGTDDAGRPASGGPFTVRVGAGLHLEPGAVFGGPRLTGIRALAVGPGGELYALGVRANFHKGDGAPSCQVLDRAGRYLRTIMPWPAGLPPERVAGFGAIDLPGQGRIPFVHHGESRSFYSHLREPDRGYAVVTGTGRLIFADSENESGGYPRPGPVRILRIEKDGGCPPEGFLGAEVVRKGSGFPALALSPDEKTLYLTGLAGRGTVWRLAVPGSGKPEPFITGLAEPRGLAVDAAGNVYVAEHGADRIAVFRPDGTRLGVAAVEKPDGIAVHRGTGAIYALAGPYSSRLVKLDGWKSGRVVASMDFRAGAAARKRPERRPVLALDWQADPPVVWVASLGGYSGYQLMRVEDAGSAFANAREVAPAGFAPLVSDMTLDTQGNRLILRYGRLVPRFAVLDLGTGRRRPFRFAFPRRCRALGAAITAGADGYLYLEVPGFSLGANPRKGLYRYSRQMKLAPFAPERDHVPVGEGSLHMLARGADVNARGEGVVLVESRRIARRALFHVLSFGPDGRVKNERIVSGLPGGGTASVRIDNAGNIYVADASRPFGHVVRPDFEGIVPAARRLPGGARNWYPAMFGSIIKFPPTGGRVGTDGKGARKVTVGFGGDATHLTTVNPDTGKEVTLDFGGTASLTGALWMREAVSPVPMTKGTGGWYYCSCEQVRFEVDGFGRVFAPDALRFQVVVLDTNGNLIGRFGTYGNVDSLKAPGALRFAWPRLVAGDHRAIYVADDLTGTILRADLAYRAEASAKVPL